MKTFLICAFIFAHAGAVLLAQTSANTEWRIPGYSSYIELKDGTVYCGEEYTSYHEGVTGRSARAANTPATTRA